MADGRGIGRPRRTATADGREPSDSDGVRPMGRGRHRADGRDRTCAVRPYFKGSSLTFLLTSVGELDAVILTSLAPPEALH